MPYLWCFLFFFLFLELDGMFQFWANHCFNVCQAVLLWRFWFSIWQASGVNVREMSRLSQPQGFGSRSEWWTEDDLWESRWSFVWIVVGQSQNSRIPPSSFLIDNRWSRWMFKKKWSTHKHMSKKIMMNSQKLNEESSWHHHHSLLTTVNDWHYMAWDKPSCLGPLLIYLSMQRPLLFCWPRWPSIQTMGSCAPPRISKTVK